MTDRGDLPRPSPLETGQLTPVIVSGAELSQIGKQIRSSIEIPFSGYLEVGFYRSAYEGEDPLGKLLHEGMKEGVAIRFEALRQNLGGSWRLLTGIDYPRPGEKKVKKYLDNQAVVEEAPLFQPLGSEEKVTVPLTSFSRPLGQALGQMLLDIHLRDADRVDLKQGDIGKQRAILAKQNPLLVRVLDTVLHNAVSPKVRFSNK